MNLLGRDEGEIVVFEVGETRYGLPIDDVREIVRAVAISPLPGAPATVEGVINVRGRIVPVLDMRRRFGLAPEAPSPDEHLILCVAKGRLVAVRAAPTTRLARVRAADVSAASEVVAGTRHVAGMIRLPDGVGLLHDIHAFLSQAEEEALHVALDHAATGAAEEGAA